MDFSIRLDQPVQIQIVAVASAQNADAIFSAAQRQDEPLDLLAM